MFGQVSSTSADLYFAPYKCAHLYYRATLC